MSPMFPAVAGVPHDLDTGHAARPEHERAILERQSAYGRYGRGPLPTVATARWIAVAQSCVSFGFLPFAAFPAAFPASEKRCFACLRERFAFFGELPAERSIRVIARSSFFPIGGGTVSSPHAGPPRAASIVQRGVVHGRVVVVDEDDARGRRGDRGQVVVGDVVVVAV